MNEPGDDSSDESSLFGSEAESCEDGIPPVADRGQHTLQALPSSIPGLYFFPNLMQEDLQDEIVDAIIAQNYFGASQNQAMLFASADMLSSGKESRLPAWSDRLIARLAELLEGRIPDSARELLFPVNGGRNPRQMIINRYAPGEGIASHRDLLDRFGDGIIICSFLSGIAMELNNPRLEQLGDAHARVSLWLPPGSVLILSKEARYDWRHGIAARPSDSVVFGSTGGEQVRDIPRQPRLSVTIRWMLPGGNIVGEEQAVKALRRERDQDC
jgi:alkylated DNA repair dioxygenase AlkB